MPGPTPLPPNLPTAPTTVAARPPTPPTRRRWDRGWIVLAVVLLGQAGMATRLFPSLGAIVDPRTPVVIVDHAIHEDHGALGAGFLRASGTTWGYDPFFMAGYPETPVWDSSSNLAILFQLLGGSGPTDFRPYKVGLFALSILGVACLALGALAVGLTPAEAAGAAALGAIYFWAGQPNMLWRSGLFAFTTVALGSSLLLGLCARFDRLPTRWGWLGLAVVAAGLFFAHVTAPIVVGGGALAFYLMVARRHDRRWHGAILGALAGTVAANLIWLVPLWRFRTLRVGSGFFLTTDSAWFLPRYYLVPTLADPRLGSVGAFVDGRLGLALIALGGSGLVGWWFRGRRAAAAALGGSVAALMLLAGLGSLWEPTRVLEPLRFTIVFCFQLTIPAASSLVGGSRWVARRLGGGVRGRLGVALVWVLVLGLWAAREPTFFRWTGQKLAEARPLAVGYPPEAGLLVDWLRRETDLSARVLVEDQLRLLERTDAESTHWTPLLPTLLGADTRLFIGGLYQTAFIQHHEMAAFGDFRLGDRFLDEWTPAEIARYADLYNLGWVVCWSPLARFTFDRLPGATRVGTIPRHATLGRPPSNNKHERTVLIRRAGTRIAQQYIIEGESNYALYRLDRPHSYFLRGRGRLVSVAPDRVELADIEPDPAGDAIISLHWFDAWGTDPACPISPESVPPDPVPMIRIRTDRPIPRLVLRRGP